MRDEHDLRLRRTQFLDEELDVSRFYETSFCWGGFVALESLSEMDVESEAGPEKDRHGAQDAGDGYTRTKHDSRLSVGSWSWARSFSWRLKPRASSSAVQSR